MAVGLSYSRVQFLTLDGKPLAGGSITALVPGTSSLKNTYLSADQTQLNTNPIILDSSGSATIFGQGVYELVGRDALGNLISDQTATGYSVGTALEAFLQASTTYDALNSLAQTGGNFAGDFTFAGKIEASESITTLTYMSATSFAITEAGQLLVTSPTANSTIATRTSLTVQGTTQYDKNREFLVSLGLTSDNGNDTDQGSVQDKVTLYVGGEVKNGSGNFWTLNTCLTVDSGSGDQIVDGFELDLNNNNKARGSTGNIITDLSATGFPSYGLQITGIGKFPNTSAIVIAGATTNTVTTTPQWNRGLTVNGYVGVASFHDCATVPNCIQFDGNYSQAAMNFTAVNGNAGAGVTTVMFMKSTQALNWQSNDKSFVIGDSVDAGDERLVGIGATLVRLSAPFVPATPNNLQMGTSDNPWGKVYCNTVYPGANDSWDLGSASLQWSDLFLTNQPTVSSQLDLKTDVVQLPSMIDLVNEINPISFKWKERGDGTPGIRTHTGFAAEHVQAALAKFNMPFAAYVEDNGNKRLRTGELLPILWTAVKELSSDKKDYDEKIKNLEDRIKLLEKK